MYFHSFIIDSFWFAYLKFKIEKKIHIKAAIMLMCPEVLRERFFCFPVGYWERVCRKLLSLVKLYQRFWIWNIDQNLNNGFTNCGCLHCAILKALHGFQEKRAHKSRDMQFFLHYVQNEIFKIFKMLKNMDFTRAACWINSKISNRDKNSTLIIFLFCHYCWLLLWCNHWKSDSHFVKKLFYLLQWKPFKNYEKCFYFIKSSPRSQDI